MSTTDECEQLLDTLAPESCYRISGGFGISDVLHEASNSPKTQEHTYVAAAGEETSNVDAAGDVNPSASQAIPNVVDASDRVEEDINLQKRQTVLHTFRLTRYPHLVQRNFCPNFRMGRN